MLFIYLCRGDLYSDLWKSDLYFRFATKGLGVGTGSLSAHCFC